MPFGAKSITIGIVNNVDRIVKFGILVVILGGLFVIIFKDSLQLQQHAPYVIPKHDNSMNQHYQQNAKHETTSFPQETPEQNPALVSGQNITINGAIEYQTMEGFGSSERVFDDPHVFDNFNPTTKRAATVVSTAEQDKILDLLYRDLGLTRVRPHTEGAGIEAVNDNSDPEATDISKFDFTWKKNDAHVSFVKKAMARGVNTYFLSTIFMEDWMTEANPKEYVEWAMTIIRRWRELGLEMPYYSIMNEPGLLNPQTGIKRWSGEYIRDVIKLLGPKLRAEGFATRIVIPDDLNAFESYQRSRIVLSDPEARKYVGALAYHLYGGTTVDKKNMKQLSEQYGIPVWMTEYFLPDGFDWANTIHDLITDFGASAVDYMWGFFGEWDNRVSPISNLITLKYSGPQYLGYEVQKHYYAMGQFSRAVRPGAVRVEAQSRIPGIKVTVFKHPADKTLTIVAINNNLSDVSVNFKLDNADLAGFSTVFRTSRTENWASLPPISLSDSFFKTILKGKSVTTFVGA